MAAKKTVPMTTYLLNMKDDTKQKVTVPADWKVTFGPLAPGSKDHGVNSSGATSLRFYTSKSQQKAVFTGVESFRDTSIAIETEVVKRQEETYYKDTTDGRKSFIVEGTVREWKNPDAPGTSVDVKPVAARLRSAMADAGEEGRKEERRPNNDFNPIREVLDGRSDF